MTMKNERRKFYTLLRQTVKTVKFRMERDGTIIGSPPSHFAACPIASIYDVKTGNKCFNTRAKAHAKDLGFGAVAQNIMDAADNKPGHNKILRATIVRICGL